MALDGYVVNVDMSLVCELVSLTRKIGNNINQITKKVNATNFIYKSEIKQINESQKQILDNLTKLVGELGDL